MNKVLARHMDSLAALVGMVRNFLRAESLPEDCSFDLDLVLEELFTNIVRHGRGSGGVEVALSAVPAGVRIVLRAGEPEPHDPAEARDPGDARPSDAPRAGGLGVHLVRRLSREFTYDWKDGVGTTTVLMGVKE